MKKMKIISKSQLSQIDNVAPLNEKIGFTLHISEKK